LTTSSVCASSHQQSHNFAVHTTTMKVTVLAAAVASSCALRQDQGHHTDPANLPQCQRPVPKSCAFYSQCIEVAHPCGPRGYAIDFGEKYCVKFNEKKDWFSEDGRRWLDGTMTCLQQKLVPMLRSPNVTCEAIRTFAFNSHPACYTNDNDNNFSVCDLPIGDWMSLVRVIGLQTLIQLDTMMNGVTTGIACLKAFSHWARQLDAFENFTTRE
ncbi:hypothetical protein H310_08837, partial [Aphanomyces invadans]